MSLVIRSSDPNPAKFPIGGKARTLAALQQTGLPVPPWFVVLPHAFTAAADAAREPVRLGDGVRAEIERALAEICPEGESVAVRSSAADEDGATHSLAGQLESFLNVDRADVEDRIAAVRASGFTERVIAYRREHGLALPPTAPAVLVQRMVDARVSGVAFGADPVSGARHTVVVSAVYGLGTGLVSGDCDADTYYVDPGNLIVRRSIVVKRRAHRRLREGGIGAEFVDDALASAPALTDDEVRQVAALTRTAGAQVGRPQDVEWAFDLTGLHLLQSRSITSLAEIADPEGFLNIWDNSNIIESYSGVTTPLTFSFAQDVYEAVYRQFCRLLRVPARRVAANERTFANMLGLIRGRVYYNLLNWYRVLAMLPGFALNRQFMEQMMGVRERLPVPLEAELARSTAADRTRDALNLASTCVGLIASYLNLPRNIRRFYRRLDAALAPVSPPLAERRADELVAYYFDLRRQLLTRWDAPLVNDFFTMIFYGTLRRLCERWCGDRDGGLQNELLTGAADMISAEPARRMLEMARAARAHPRLPLLMRDGSLETISAVLPEAPDVQALYNAYLAAFGERCLDELKLETATLHDDPLPLFRAVGHLAMDMPSPSAATVRADTRSRAERRVAQALTRKRWRRIVFSWVLRNARARVRDRENLRFERTRVFGRVRRIFVELGKRLHEVNALAQPRDVFYLELDEVLAFVEGRATATNLKGLVGVRKAEFDAYRVGAPPAERFETRGIVYSGNAFGINAAPEEQPRVGDERKGTGCSPGVVRGPVRIVRDAARADLSGRWILVAERTDPGWIMIFPAATGLLVERGSLLSHSAILARELAIPAVVSIAGVTTWLEDGDEVELDGTTGVVRRVRRASVRT
jgi:phosphohistidine swiveling domain-containing protein